MLGARARRADGAQGGARARVDDVQSRQRRARVEQLCVGVEQRWQGLRSVPPSPHAAGAQRLTQLRVGPRVPLAMKWAAERWWLYLLAAPVTL